MTLRILIVDDEPPARQNLVHLLRQTEPGAQIQEADNGIEAARLLGETKPQLLFLDIQMPGLDGLELMRFLPKEKRPVTVFVTAHRDFAVEAFDLEAVDYLVKPFSRERFGQTMQRVRQSLQHQHESNQKGPPPRDSEGRLPIKDGHRHYLVAIEDIDWVSAAGNYVEIHVGTTSHLMRATMKDLPAMLCKDRFVRIHRSILVNRNRVREIEATESGDYRVHLQNGKHLTMSRRRKQALRQLLGRDG